ncbi:MAG: GTP cyclohydrolase II RibA [Actinomycetota bacterium]|nr:GTP cyclohydrolase II RibA [Actinomycetota bacterium]
MELPREVARVPIATSAGEFDVRAFACRSGFVYLVLVKGVMGDGQSVLTRLHSECLTGDALGSLRCDCGIQLRFALRRISAEGRGVLVYATGHEGRGIGLVNKLLAYTLQDRGLDTLDANSTLGLPVDGRDYGEAAKVLLQTGVRSVRLLTNNPEKALALEANGIEVEAVLPVRTSAHVRNAGYLTAKRARLGHLSPAGNELSIQLAEISDSRPAYSDEAVDVSALVGKVRYDEERPYVLLKYAQTLDGRIATSTGDSKWISGEPERQVSHALRAACDAVLVGVGTVRRDNPRLTVRKVPGHSPIRVVLDSALRLPLDANVLDSSASTIVITTEQSDPKRRLDLAQMGVGVQVVPTSYAGVDLEAALHTLRLVGIRSLLVEGGSRVITSLLSRHLVDRLIVGIAPVMIGAGTEAVGDLGITKITDGLKLNNRLAHVVGGDVLLAGDISPAADRGSKAIQRRRGGVSRRVDSARLECS